MRTVWPRLPHFVQNLIVGVLIEGMLIISMAWLFSQLDSTRATLIIGSAIVVVLIPVSFVWFRYGVWVDLAAPIVAMQLHQAYATFQRGTDQRGTDQPAASG